MPLSSDELQTIKNELTNDPLSLGLTVLPADDEANANALNLVRDTIRVHRASVPSNSILIPVDEWGAMSESQQSWWDNNTADGSIDPAVTEPEFYKVFGPSTAARASFDSVSKESASRTRQLLGRHYTLTPSDVANARQV